MIVIICAPVTIAGPKVAKTLNGLSDDNLYKIALQLPSAKDVVNFTMPVTTFVHNIRRFCSVLGASNYHKLILTFRPLSECANSLIASNGLSLIQLLHCEEARMKLFGGKQVALVLETTKFPKHTVHRSSLKYDMLAVI